MNKPSVTTRSLLPVLARHKYIWTIVFFAIIAGFLDENSFWQYYKLSSHNAELRSEIRSYEDEYNSSTSELKRLRRSPEALEEMARVHLLMKSSDEDLYVIE